MEADDPHYKIVQGYRVKKKKSDLEKRLTLEEAEQLLSSINFENHKNYWRRNKAIIEFMLHTALRVGEVSQLVVSDVISVSGKPKTLLDVRPETAKRKKARQIPLNDTARAAVQVLLEGRDPSFNDALITKPNGKRLSKRGVQNIVTTSALKANITRLVGAHMLRHTCLSEVYENTGGNAKITQQIAGHSNPSLTLRLYAHTSLTAMAEAMGTLDKKRND